MFKSEKNNLTPLPAPSFILESDHTLSTADTQVQIYRLNFINIIYFLIPDTIIKLFSKIFL